MANSQEQQQAAISSAQPTANEQLVDSAVYQGINLQRVAKTERAKVLKLLADASEEITGKLQAGKLTDWQSNKAKQFIDFANATIAKAYEQIDGVLAKDLPEIGKAEIHKQIKSVNEAVGAEISPAMSAQQLSSIAKADELLVSGAVLSDWWAQQAAGLQHDILTTVQSGLVQGKSVGDIAKAIESFMPQDENDSKKKIAAQAEAVVRTAIATVQSDAQSKYYENNDDIIKGIRWTATLDARTTPLCRSLDGLTWTYDPDPAKMKPVGHNTPWPGMPPVHWNCRSTTTPVLHSWQELANVELPHQDDQTVQEIFEKKLADQGFSDEQIAQAAVDQRASVDGAVPAAMTYEDWLKSKPETTQQQILGQQRWQLWKDGKVSLQDMVDGNGKLLSIEQLQAAAKEGVAVPPGPPAEEGQDGLSLAERTILQAQHTDALVNGNYRSTWLDTETGITVDQAVTHTLSDTEFNKLTGWSEEAAGREIPTPQLVHLSNSLNASELWDVSELKIFAAVPGFTGAKLVTQSGKVAVLKLKPGKSWEASDIEKYLEGYNAATKKYKDKVQLASAGFAKTGKVTFNVTKVGTIESDAKALKAVYPPLKEKPPPYVTPKIPTAEEIAAEKAKAEAEAAAAAKQAAFEAAQKAEEEALKATVESQAARAKAKEEAAKTAEERLAAHEQSAYEGALVTAKVEAEAAQKKAEEKAADQAAFAQKLAGPLTEHDAMQQWWKYDDLDAAIEDAKAANKPPSEIKALQEQKDYEKDKYDQIKEALEAQQKAAQEAAAWADKLAGPLTEADITEQSAKVNAIGYGQPGFEAEHDKLNQLIDAYNKQLEAKEAAEAAEKKAQEDAQKAAEALAAKEAKKAAAAAKKAAKAALKAAQAAPSDFPLDPENLKVVKELGGATHAQLVTDEAGTLFVRKRGANAAHIESETLADELYRIAGQPVPESKLYQTAQGPIKLSRYVPNAEILGDYLKHVSPAEAQRVLKEIHHSFVAHALFANWDAVGANPAAGNDNIIVDKTGKAWMIDAGGALDRSGLGAKKAGKFGPKVEELQTMLDPSINPTTAPVFKGITQQEIKDQIGQILSVRDKLLAATPEPLKSKLEQRLDYLADYAGIKPEQLKVGMGSWASDPAIVQEIADSKITGYDVLSDKDAVENARALVWTEKTQAGDPITIAQFKLRPEAMNELEARLKPLLPKTAAPQTPTAQLKTLPDDIYYSDILTGVKTVNYHVNDGAYNDQKVKAALALKPQLEHIAATGDAAHKAMAQQYLSVLKQIEDSIAQKPTGKLIQIPDISQYQPPPPPKPSAQAAAVQASEPFKVSAQPLIYTEKKFAKGNATQLSTSALNANGTGYYIEAGDVTVRYVPGGAMNDRIWAVQGEVHVQAPGAPSPEALAKIEATLKDLGIDMTPPTDDFRKALYLTQNIYYLDKAKPPAMIEQIMGDKTISDAERLKKIAEIAKKDYKIAITDDRWMGKTAPDGDGYRYWLRADMTPEKIGQELPGYVLTHHVNTGQQTFTQAIDSFLNSGGELTPTTERGRKGVSVKKTGGASSITDLNTGGSSYFFTRINQTSSISSHHLILSIEHLARLDAMSYNGDKFGNVRHSGGDHGQGAIFKRGTTIANFKANARDYSNETLFKYGFDFVSDVEYVVVTNAHERDETLKILRKHGVTELSGRKIEDAVITQGQTFTVQ